MDGSFHFGQMKRPKGENTLLGLVCTVLGWGNYISIAPEPAYDQTQGIHIR